jgi:hypothetical protein
VAIPDRLPPHVPAAPVSLELGLKLNGQYPILDYTQTVAKKMLRSKKSLYVVAAILGWLLIFVFFNFTHIGNLILGGMGFIVGLAALGGGVLAFGYGIATDKEFRRLIRSILVLGTTGAFLIVVVYGIYLAGSFLIHWIYNL